MVTDRDIRQAAMSNHTLRKCLEPVETGRCSLQQGLMDAVIALIHDNEKLIYETAQLRLQSVQPVPEKP